jgi:hypothetical protein
MCLSTALYPQDPATLDELQAVLGVVAAVRGEGMMMELRCGELEERYRTRLLYAVRAERFRRAGLGIASWSSVG